MEMEFPVKTGNVAFPRNLIEKALFSASLRQLKLFLCDLQVLSCCVLGDFSQATN